MTAFWHRRGFERAVAKHRMVDIVDGQKAGAPVARGGRRDRDAASRAYEAARSQHVSWLDAARAASEDVNFVQRMRPIALPDRSVEGDHQGRISVRIGFWSVDPLAMAG